MRTCNAKLLLGLLLLVSCGNRNSVEVFLPNIVSANLTITSLKDSKVLLKKNIQGPTIELGVLESGIGFEDIEMKISHATYVSADQKESQFEEDDYFSSMVPSDFTGNHININAFTTLASCRFHQVSDFVLGIKTQIREQNNLVATQWLLDEIHASVPEMNFKDIKVLDQATIYGVILGGFEALAHQYGSQVSKFTSFVCADLEYDGVLNGVDQLGDISTRLVGYDDQVMKNQLARALYDFLQRNIESLETVPTSVLANEVSMSLVPSLFSPTIQNISFEP